MEGFSEITQKLLLKAGWSQGRSVDTRRYEQALRDEGYPVHEAAVRFLRAFGGLKVHHPHPKVAGQDDYFSIDPIGAIKRVYKDTVDEYAARVGVPLCLVGEAERGSMVLAMAADGAVYAEYDDFLVKAGGDPAAAIEAFCRGWEMPQIP
ncbi:MAG TPA: SUKH-3 domain-containing protein [Roseiflexaceae bacterium]|nr:SUKH-3 domain-containing protein [Roseiflexaceae bacterium]